MPSVRRGPRFFFWCRKKQKKVAKLGSPEWRFGRGRGTSWTGKGDEEMFVVCEGENAQGVVTVSVFPDLHSYNDA